jgi:hypothetical protein
LNSLHPCVRIQPGALEVGGQVQETSLNCFTVSWFTIGCYCSTCHRRTKYGVKFLIDTHTISLRNILNLARFRPHVSPNSKDPLAVQDLSHAFSSWTLHHPNTLM